LELPYITYVGGINENQKISVLYLQIIIMEKEANKKTIDCGKCIHFYITWDKHYPKGCKAMGFKSVEMPSIIVYKSSGADCLRFEMKEARDKRCKPHV
jgi:L,D-peptidoglycan transpeptidase YkuD (ErfK/YbiS/YcfS/YnhG family)